MADDAAVTSGDPERTGDSLTSGDSEQTGDSVASREPTSGATELDTAPGEAAREDAAGSIDAPGEPVSGDAQEDAPARLSHVRLALIAGLVAVVALGGLAGWLGYRANQSHHLAQQRELFLQVGRQGAINLTTLDFEHIDADVQRILDSATGTFYDDFQQRAPSFIQVVKQVQSKSFGTVTSAALESDDATEAEVLVAVTVRSQIVGQPDQRPRSWRMRILVQRVQDDAKVSNVEFVP